MLFQRKRFVTPDLAAELITLIEAGRRPSTIADDNGDPVFRTSETCDLPMREPDIVTLDERLSALSGIDRQFGEPIQGQRYDSSGTAQGSEFQVNTYTTSYQLYPSVAAEDGVVAQVQHGRVQPQYRRPGRDAGAFAVGMGGMDGMM